MRATTAQSPSASDSGTWIATWYKPANPGASAAPYTVAGRLSMVTVGSALVEYVVSPGVSTPTGAAGVVGPKPVPHRMIVSPGFAGTVVEPANVPLFAAKLKSCRVATTWLLGHGKNAGPNGLDVTVNAALDPAEFFTTTCCEPEPTSGTTKLICPGLM